MHNDRTQAKGPVGNRLCRLLDIRYPIIQGGMTLVGTGKLAAAVSAGGGLGVVSAGRMTVVEFAEELTLALAATDRPLGVNIPIGRDEEWLRACFAAANKSAVKAVFIGGGNPKPWIPIVKDAGKLLGIVVATPEQASKAEAAGADLVIAESIEAGGRTSREELAGITLIPASAAAVQVPLVAAGSIVDGRGMAAALCLGADGVQMGTRFMLCTESPLHEAAMRAMLDAGIGDTMVIGKKHRMGRRVLRSKAAENVQDREDAASVDDMIGMLSGEWSWQGIRRGDMERGMIACGQGVGLIRDVKSAADIIADTVAEAARCLAEKAADTRSWLDAAPPDA